MNLWMPDGGRATDSGLPWRAPALCHSPASSHVALLSCPPCGCLSAGPVPGAEYSLLTEDQRCGLDSFCNGPEYRRLRTAAVSAASDWTMCCEALQASFSGVQLDHGNRFISPQSARGRLRTCRSGFRHDETAGAVLVEAYHAFSLRPLKPPHRCQKRSLAAA
jgi:hypothetical protein